MTRNLALAISYCFAISVTVSAQNVAPVVTTPIAPFTLYAGAPARSIDLTTAFADPDASNAVQLSVSLPSSTGTFTIALDGQHKPVTVGNFLNYVNFGRYFPTDPTTHTARIELYPSFCSRFRRARRRICRHGQSGTPEQRSADSGRDFPADSE